MLRPSATLASRRPGSAQCATLARSYGGGVMLQPNDTDAGAGVARGADMIIEFAAWFFLPFLAAVLCQFLTGTLK